MWPSQASLDFSNTPFSLDSQESADDLSAILTPLPRHHERHSIAEGDKGTVQTIVLMQKMVNTWKRDDAIRNIVGQVLNGHAVNAPTDSVAFLPTNRPCASKDYTCYAKKLYEWVRDEILYTYDPHLVEYVESPLRVIKNRIGDCDSKDMLLCAMLEHIGLQTQFVTIKADAQRPDEYSHVYCRVKIPNVGWMAADPTMPKYFGWEPPQSFPKRYWPATTDALSLPLDTAPCVGGGMSGLGRCALSVFEKFGVETEAETLLALSVVGTLAVWGISKLWTKSHARLTRKKKDGDAPGPSRLKAEPKEE